MKENGKFKIRFLHVLLHIMLLMSVIKQVHEYDMIFETDERGRSDDIDYLMVSRQLEGRNAKVNRKREQ